jgi:hypothetical protein
MAHSFLRGLPSDLDPVRQGPMARNVKDTSLTETLGFCRLSYMQGKVIRSLRRPLKHQTLPQKTPIGGR